MFVLTTKVFFPVQTYFIIVLLMSYLGCYYILIALLQCSICWRDCEFIGYPIGYFSVQIHLKWMFYFFLPCSSVLQVWLTVCWLLCRPGMDSSPHFSLS